VSTYQTAAKRPREVKHDVIHIKVPCLFNIFDKVRFTSILSNSQSDHVSLVDAPIGNLIMHNFERSIEGNNLLISNKMNSECIDQCTIKIRKADSSNILAFKCDVPPLSKDVSS
jgi:hypothetical protein